MKTIQLKQITLINFKGCKNLTIDFEKNTDIFGANRSGKTTIFDSFCWLLFGKDSQDRAAFEVKTLDSNNKVIPRVEHTVEAIIVVDNQEIILRKILSEKWVKKKGNPQPEFVGNTIEHYWNGVPLGTAREYTERVNSILDETVFKMITNPLAFMALKWQDRRDILLKIAEQKSDKSLATGNREYESLIARLQGNKTLEEYSKEIQASIKKTKEELKAIPTRIDEVVRNKPESMDWQQIEYLIELKGKQIAEIDLSIEDKSSAFDTKLEEINAQKSQANVLRANLETREIYAKNKAKEKAAEINAVPEKLKKQIAENYAAISTYEGSVDTLIKKRILLESENENITKQIDAKRAEWYAENEKVLIFEGECFDCPTCKRQLDPNDIEAQKTKMQADFIASKQAALASITESAKALKSIQESQQKEIDELIFRINNGYKLIDELKNQNTDLMIQLQGYESENKEQNQEEIYSQLIAADELYHKKKAELAELEAKIEHLPKIDYSELTEKKKALQSELDSLKAKMQIKKQIKIAEDRIKQLEAEELILSQQILDVERTQFIINNFNRVKIEHLENSINSKLKGVKFKMFDRLINGGEVEICEAISGGVPFSNLNTEGKINSGLDIINMLCEFYQVSAPIVIDNRESVSTIIECKSQIINLMVEEGSDLSVNEPYYTDEFLQSINKTREEMMSIFYAKTKQWDKKRKLILNE